MCQHKLRSLREQAVEEAIRLGGYQTTALGRDRHGRAYLRFPGDPRRVFVDRWTTEGDEDSHPRFPGVVEACRGGAGLVPFEVKDTASVCFVSLMDNGGKVDGGPC